MLTFANAPSILFRAGQQLSCNAQSNAQSNAGITAPDDPQSTYTSILGGRGFLSSQYAISYSVTVVPIFNTHLTTSAE